MAKNEAHTVKRLVVKGAKKGEVKPRIGKDKQFHADGTMTAAEFKRRYCNKAAQKRAALSVDVRSTIGAGVMLDDDGEVILDDKGRAVPLKATAADKKQLRTQWYNRDPQPGSFHKAEKPNSGGAGIRLNAARHHLVTSF